MGSYIWVAVDIGRNSHHVGAADPEGKVFREVLYLALPRKFPEVLLPNRTVPFEVRASGSPGGLRWLRTPLGLSGPGKGYYNVDNLKLARFREISPGLAKTDSLNVHKFWSSFQLKVHLFVVTDLLEGVWKVAEVNRKPRRLTRGRRQLVNGKVGGSELLTDRSSGGLPRTSLSTQERGQLALRGEAG